MGGNKGSTQMWVNQTTSNKENGVGHPSTLQLDQDIQAFRRMIGVAKEQGGLYYLQHTKIEVMPTQDVQVQVQEVMPTQDIQVQEVTKPTLVLEKVQMSKLDVSIPNNSIEEQVQLFEPEVSIPNNSIEDVTDDMPIALRKGKRSCVKYPISQLVSTDHLSVQHQSFITTIDAIKTPTSVHEALKEEMEALEKNSTWEIVDIPKDKRAIGYRWICTVKCKSDVTLE
ncbi:hypothetical protein CR513_23341, partial [Mucuna pruriens]